MTCLLYTSITDVLCGLKFKISPLSFWQVNRAQAEKLYGKAKEYANLQNDEILNFNTKKQEINPDHNDRLLSVANGFEDGSWRYRQFKEFVFSNICLLYTSNRRQYEKNLFVSIVEMQPNLSKVSDYFLFFG